MFPFILGQLWSRRVYNWWVGGAQATQETNPKQWWHFKRSTFHSFWKENTFSRKYKKGSGKVWTAWVVRGHTNQEYEQMSHEQITERLKVLGDDKNHLRDSPEQRKEWLIRFERTRHLMVWGRGGGGSTILNHGFLLYIIQCVYDPAFS